jgi:hypothetical protein
MVGVLETEKLTPARKGLFVSNNMRAKRINHREGTEQFPPSNRRKFNPSGEPIGYYSVADELADEAMQQFREEEAEAKESEPKHRLFID